MSDNLFVQNRKKLLSLPVKTIPAMQDTLVRVFVVALSLLAHPRHDPGIKEQDDVARELGERMLRKGESLDRETTPFSQEIMYTDNTGPQEHLKSFDKEKNETPGSRESDQNVTEKDKTQLLDVRSVTNQDSEEDKAGDRLRGDEHFIANSNPGLLEKTTSERETELRASDVIHEDQLCEPQTRGCLKLNVNSEPRALTDDSSESQRQHENPAEKEGGAPLSDLQTKTAEDGSSEMAFADGERDYLWYMWNIFSFISTIRFLRKHLGNNSQKKHASSKAFPATCTADEVPLPDSGTLQCFYSQRLRGSSVERWRRGEFLEGLTNDLLESMRAICDRGGGMEIEDFLMVDECDIIVPITPRAPYRFQCQRWTDPAADPLPDTQLCGQIKLVENKRVPNSCHCQSPDADDMVCLLHCENMSAKTEIADVYDGPLCVKNSPLLSKSQVTRWFQSTIKQAWAQISHKYGFELSIRYVDAPGALVVRFRSGRKISFNMNPVVRLNSSGHLYIAPCPQEHSDTLWTLSLTPYEDRFLDHISEQLPQNSCHIQTLKIAYFLHRRQTALSGSSALKSSHFKAALLQLLFTKNPSEWKSEYLACRLRDLLAFIERSLEEKLLHHILIGNPLTENTVELPAEFAHAKPVNLFHPLVAHNCIYTNAVTHFQEILKNAHMLILDYVGNNSGNLTTKSVQSCS